MAIKRKKRSSKQVFIAYPYRLYQKSAYRAVFRNLEKRYAVTFIFADERITNMQIMKKIESYITSSDFTIFDISGWNPNVTLELGYAMALGDQWYIVINPKKHKANEAPSDIRGLDRIQYSSFEELSEKVQALLEQRYPKRKGMNVDNFLAAKEKELVKTMRKIPNQTLKSLSQLVGMEQGVVKAIISPLVKSRKIKTTGNARGTKYYLPGTLRKRKKKEG